MAKPLEKIIEDLGFLPGPAVGCAARPLGTNVEYVVEDRTFNMRLADFIEMERKLPKKVFFKGSTSEILRALQKDLEYFAIKRKLLGVGVGNSLLLGGVAGALINPAVCLSTYVMFAPLAILYCAMPSEKELLTTYYLNQQSKSKQYSVPAAKTG